MVDGKILMEVIPRTNGEKLLSNFKGANIVDLRTDRKGFQPRKGLLITPKDMAKELTKDESVFLLGHNPSLGSKGYEIALFHNGIRIARTAPQDIQPQLYFEIKGIKLRALYSDWKCLNQIFGRL